MNEPTLFPRGPFAGFGASRMIPPEHPPLTGRARGGAAKLRQLVRHKVPRVPGVYGWLDRRNRLIYVGKAKSLRTRLLCYFRKASRDPKAGRILDASATIVWEEAPSEFAALLRELELIRRFLPRFNVVGVPGRQRTSYLCVGREPAPYVFASRRPTGKEVAVYGPVPGTGRAADAARRLNDLFRLRDCSQKVKMHFADEPDLFGAEKSPRCLRADIGTCSAPCAAMVGRDGYAKQIRAVRAFFDGTDTRLLGVLEREMGDAAAAMDFERAAAVRDRHRPLRWLADHLGWLKEARQSHSFVYPLAGRDAVELWYHIHRGRVWAVAAAPTCPATRRTSAARIERIYKGTGGAETALPADEVDSVLLVASWFRKNAAERGRLMTPTEALTKCRTADPTAGGPPTSGGQTG